MPLMLLKGNKSNIKGIFIFVDQKAAKGNKKELQGTKNVPVSKQIKFCVNLTPS